MAHQIRARADLPEEHKWDAASVFPTPAEWEREFRSVEDRLPDLAEFRGRIGEGPASLADWFAAEEAVSRSLGLLRVYAYLSYSVDANDQAAASRLDRFRALRSRTDAATAFAEPELLAVGLDRLREWTGEDPRLAHFGHYFEVIERKRHHVRTADVEEVISQAADPLESAATIHGVLANADLKFAPATGSSGESSEVAQGTIDALKSSPDRETRRTAWENYSEAHIQVKNTMAASLATGIKRDVFIARARRYESSLQAALEPNHIPMSAFHTMLATFRRNIPTWHRYWRIRRQALGLNELFIHDTRAVLAREQPPLPFAQSVEWVLEGVAPLGAEYQEVLSRGVLEQRWVDIYPNRGKRMGAFSTGAPGTHPFIFMSYNDDIFSMSTLAHEIGHSMHSYYSRKHQPFIYTGYGLFVAEVASNFHQALVRAHLLKVNSDPEFQLAVLEEAMANFHRYFFIMPSLARFELEVHERVERGEALSADSLNELMADLLLEVYGDELQLRPGDRERIGSTWSQFHTHLYSNFYVYQYATGIAGANWLADKVLAGESGAAESYLEFIKAGASLYPMEALQLAGVDMTSPEPMDRAFAVMAQMVDRLEQLVGARPIRA